MKILYWRMLVSAVVAVALISFLFVFRTEITSPRLAGIPYILWSSFLLTVLLVVMTYIGFKLFPYKEEQS